MDRCNGEEPWNCWSDEDFLLAKGNDIVDMPECLWENETQEEEFSYILEESTPIRACNGVPHDYNQYGGSIKASQQCIETYPSSKRRRTLHFNTEDVNLSCQNEDFSFLKSKETMASVDVAAGSSVSIQGSRFEVEDISSSGMDCLDQFEGWFTECLNDPEMQFSPDDMISSGSSEGCSDSTVGIQHGSSNAPVTQPNAGHAQTQQQRIRPCGNIILRGRKSYMTTPTKLGSSVAYPFTFIKPSVANGDVTLTDINQRIKTPPKPKEPTFGTSAITGKPVVTKTRIRTDGGRGSITIMRTKG